MSILTEKTRNGLAEKQVIKWTGGMKKKTGCQPVLSKGYHNGVLFDIYFLASMECLHCSNRSAAHSVNLIVRDGRLPQFDAL